MIFGYARVSTDDQDLRLQTGALEAAGCDQIHQEKASGAELRRPVLMQLLSQLRPGDQVRVWKLDRLTRSLPDLLTLLHQVDAAGATFASCTEPVDTSTPAGAMLMQLLGVFAQFERAMIRERTRAGMVAARGRGVKMGRPGKLLPIEEAELRASARAGNLSWRAIADRYDISVSTAKRIAGR